ncbi:UNVERIFIED_CONTAM: hypothetical protein HPS20_08980 [Pseudomonas sp. CM11]
MELNLVPGEVCTLTLDYEYSWLIGDPDAQVLLEYKPGEEAQGLVFDPPLGQLVAMEAGSTALSWSISTQETQIDPFVLQFDMPLMSGMPKSPPLPGQISQPEFENTFDEIPVTFGGSAYPCHGARHTFTVRPHSSSQFLNKNVKLVWSGEPAADLGVVITPPLHTSQLLGPEGVTWQLNFLNTTQDADFSLHMEAVESGETTEVLAMSLGNNLVKVERWTTRLNMDSSTTSPPPDRIKSIRARSRYSNKVAAGIEVLVNGGPSGIRTDERGEASIDEFGDDNFHLSIRNRYDGSTV